MSKKMSKREKRVKEQKKNRNREKTAPKPRYATQCHSFGTWRHVRYFLTLEAADKELEFIQKANEANMPPIRVVDIKEKTIVRTYEGTRVTDKPKMDLESVKEK